MTKQDLKLLLIVCAVIAVIVGGFLSFVLWANSSYTPEEVMGVKPMKLNKKESILKEKIIIQEVMTLDEWRNQAPQLLMKEANNMGWAEFLREYQGKDFHIIIKDIDKK